MRRRSLPATVFATLIALIARRWALTALARRCGADGWSLRTRRRLFTGGGRLIAPLAWRRRLTWLLARSRALIGRSGVRSASLLRTYCGTRWTIAQPSAFIALERLRRRNILHRLNRVGGLPNDARLCNRLAGPVAATAQILGADFGRAFDIGGAGHDAWHHFESAHRLTRCFGNNRGCNARIYCKAAAAQ